MYIKTVAVLLLVVFMVMLVGCSAHTHIVGDGAQGMQQQEARQWYILWGLVPINDVNTQMLAGNADDYTIHTETSFLDFVINIFTQWVTVTSRTVTVTR